MHVLARKIVGVLAHVERADQHGAGRLHALDQPGIARRWCEVAVDLRSGAGGKALDVEQVFYRERNTGEWADFLSGGDPGIDRLGRGARTIGSDVSERIQHAVMRSDPRQCGLGRFEGRKLAVDYRLRDLLGRQPV